MRQPHDKQRGRFRFNSQIGQNIAHERLIDQQFSKRMAMPRVMHGLHQRLTHKTSGRDGAIEARVVDHLNNGLNASSLFTHQVRPSLRKLNFARCIGAIAQFVLEPLNEELVARAVGKDAAPRNAETIGAESELLHQRHVAFVTAVVVAGNVAGLAVRDEAGRMTEAMPDALPCSIGER